VFLLSQAFGGVFCGQSRSKLNNQLEGIRKLNDQLLTAMISPADAEERIQQMADVRDGDGNAQSYIPFVLFSFHASYHRMSHAG